MSDPVNEAVPVWFYLDQADRALKSLKRHVTAQGRRQTRLVQVCNHWQSVSQAHADEMHRQFNELAIRLGPWLSRTASPPLSVVASRDESA